MIKAVVFDVDGTLTDGKIHISESGELFKSFDVKDGYGIRNILPTYGIIPVIITGRTSKIVEFRAKELGIEYLYQGIKDKAGCVRDIAEKMDIPLNHIACIGDDLNDIPMMELCGLRGCPSDAVADVKEICDYVCKSAGGHGAVREFIEWLIDQC